MKNKLTGAKRKKKKNKYTENKVKERITNQRKLNGIRERGKNDQETKKWNDEKKKREMA